MVNKKKKGALKGKDIEDAVRKSKVKPSRPDTGPGEEVCEDYHGCTSSFKCDPPHTCMGKFEIK